MKLLIVEDDLFFQKFYSQKLTEAGYQVEVASDGNEGLIKMNSMRPDLVLLDLIMPNKDGFEVLQAVSQNPQLKRIPIIVFSTLGDEEDVKRAMQYGVVDYINKSFHDVEILKAKINAHLSGKPAPVQQVPDSSPIKIPQVVSHPMPPISPVQQQPVTSPVQQPNPQPVAAPQPVPVQPINNQLPVAPAPTVPPINDNTTRST